MIKFVYFDVGGVVINDFSGTNNWSEFKKEIGINENSAQNFELLWDKLENEICIGKDINSIIPGLNTHLGLKIDTKYDLLHSFVGRFRRNESIWPVIREVNMNYSIGLLTN